MVSVLAASAQAVFAFAQAPVIVADINSNPAEAIATSTALTSAGEAKEAAHWLEARGTLSRSKLNEVHASDAVPQLQGEIELGMKGEALEQDAEGPADRGAHFVYDVALFGRFSSSFRTRDAAGNEEEVVPPTRTRRNVNLDLQEFYGATTQSPFVFSMGKRRLRGGPGYAVSPSNPLATERNVLDPRDDGAGRWMASMERLTPQGSLGLHVSPGVREHERGYPDAVFRYRLDPWRPVRAHAVAVAQGNIAVSDTELGATLSAIPNDLGKAAFRPAIGLSLRREIDNRLSFHGDVLFRQGSGRLFADKDCARTEVSLAGCFKREEEVLDVAADGQDDWNARFVLGGRRGFESGASLALEWHHDSAGETLADFERIIAVNAYVRSIDKYSLPLSRQKSYARTREKLETALGDGRSFSLRANNSLLASVEDVPLAENIAIGSSTALSLLDNSGVIAPRLSWTPAGWRVQAHCLFPYTLGAKKSARNPAGGRVAESDALVYRYLVQLSVRHYL